MIYYNLDARGYGVCEWAKKLCKSLLLPVITASLAVSPCYGAWQPMQLLDSAMLEKAKFIAKLSQVRIIFIGEIHDQQQHHVAQLEIIDALHRQGVAIAIGMEMMAATKQRELDLWVAGRLTLEEIMTIYNEEWGLPWPLYRDIFFYAQAHRIPLLGLNLPKEISNKVAREGFASLTKRELRLLPEGVTCAIDPSYRIFIRRAFAVHSQSERSFEHFCEAQMLWNNSMIHYLQEYLGYNPGKTIVVLTGIGHALKRGLPFDSLLTAGGSFQVVIPELADINREKATSADADYLLLFK